MAGLAPLARLQAINSSGVPISGAKLYTYAGGTSTPLATYTTSALSVENANPVVADAGGLFGAIYLAASNYKFVLKTSADVEVWTQDSIENATATNIVNADISASAAIAWTKISKTGSSLSDLTTRSAAALSSGTLPDARFPATLPAASGVNLTALNATNLTSGTVPDARFPATLPAVSGVNLTALNATSIASGTLATARVGTVLGTWTTIAVDTVVQAATDLFLTGTTDQSSTIEVRTDSSNPPTTVRCTASGGGERAAAYACMVKKSDYVKIALTGGSAATTYAIPIGN
jgi:hypothetical protein